MKACVALCVRVIIKDYHTLVRRQLKHGRRGGMDAVVVLDWEVHTQMLNWTERQEPANCRSSPVLFRENGRNDRFLLSYLGQFLIILLSRR